VARAREPKGLAHPREGWGNIRPEDAPF